MNVARKYIPLAVRVQVAARQLRERSGALDRSILYGLGLLFDCDAGDPTLSSRGMLRNLLFALFGPEKSELHHRPSLVNRPWNKRKQDYDPPANSPEHLVYLPKDNHRIETLVRGERGQLSDAGLRRKNKRMAKNREKRSATRIKRGGHSYRKIKVLPKRQWTSRPFLKGRKLRSRR